MSELTWTLLIQLGFFGGEVWRLQLWAYSGAVVSYNHLIKCLGCSGRSVAGGGGGLGTAPCVK